MERYREDQYRAVASKSKRQDSNHIEQIILVEVKSGLAKGGLKQKLFELLHFETYLARLFVRKLHLCILYHGWPRSFVGEVDLCIVWLGCLSVKWTSRAVVRNLTRMSGHDVKFARVCIYHAQRFGDMHEPHVCIPFFSI